MINIVNLNKYRKKTKAIEKQGKAEENRVKYGRTKAQKSREKKTRDDLEKHLDAHKKDFD